MEENQLTNGHRLKIQLLTCDKKKYMSMLKRRFSDQPIKDASLPSVKKWKE